MYVCVYVFMYVFRGTGFEIICGKHLSKMRVGGRGGGWSRHEFTNNNFAFHESQNK